MVEQFHENLGDEDLPGLNDFGFVTVEPAFFQVFVFSDIQIAFVVTLHDTHYFAYVRESHVQQFLHVQVLNFNYVLSVLGERSATDFLSTDDLDVDLLA